MNKIKSNRVEISSTLGACGCWIFFWLCFVFIGAFCLNYTVDTWLLLSGKGGDFPFIMAFLFCFVPGVGQISAIAAVLTFIATFFV